MKASFAQFQEGAVKAMQEQVSAFQKILDKIIELVVSYGFQAIGALIVLAIGYYLSNWVFKASFGALKQKGIDPTISKFLAMTARFTVLGFSVVIALGNFGITIAPFVAALGGLAFGASFAIQGPLSNYGAGLSIILSRPFTVGDTITVAGVSGVVEDVRLASTIVMTEDNIRITIPNKHIVGEIVQNSKGNRIVEGVVGISYDSDPDAAIRVIHETLGQFSEVVREPAPQVGIQEFADSAVNIGFRYWVPTLKYYQLAYAINLKLYRLLQETGIKIPYPQRDVHIVSQPASTRF